MADAFGLMDLFGPIKEDMELDNLVGLLQDDGDVLSSPLDNCPGSPSNPTVNSSYHRGEQWILMCSLHHFADHDADTATGNMEYYSNSGRAGHTDTVTQMQG
jgi:hypothetical protein